jgi:hypothetical protein
MSRMRTWVVMLNTSGSACAVNTTAVYGDVEGCQRDLFFPDLCVDRRSRQGPRRSQWEFEKPITPNTT